MPNISIIIPVYNREDFIEDCLTSVINQTFEDFEIIVIDDCSTDSTYNIVKEIQHSKVRLYRNSVNSGICISRNKGIQESDGKFIVFTDSDCIVDRQWLDNLLSPFSIDPAIMIVGGHIVDPLPKTYWERIKETDYSLPSKSGYTKTIVGCNMAFRRSLFDQVRFDGNIRYGGDELDLCLWCRQNGFKIYYSHAAKTTHYHRSNFRGLFLQSYKCGYGNAYVYVKHNMFPFRTPNSTWLMLAAAGMLFFSAFKLLLPANYLFPLIILASLMAIVQVRKERHIPIQQYLFILPGCIIVNIAHTAGKLTFLFRRMTVKIWPVTRKKSESKS